MLSVVGRTDGAQTQVLVFSEEDRMAIFVHGGRVFAPGEGKERKPLLRLVGLRSRRQCLDNASSQLVVRLKNEEE